MLELIESGSEQTGIDPSNLVLEVIETAAIANLDRARGFATKLQSFGCRFALDDFGDGFGSFYYLKHIPFDYVKIDGGVQARALCGVQELGRQDQLVAITGKAQQQLPLRGEVTGEIDDRLAAELEQSGLYRSVRARPR